MEWISTRQVDNDMISVKDLDLLQVIDDPAEVVEAVQKFYDARQKKPAEPEDTERQTGMYL